MNPLLDPRARLVIAHRGNRVHWAENTIESFVSAIEVGADAVEFDVRMTADGVPVLLHDATLDRTTNGHGLLRSYSVSDIRTLDVASPDAAHAGRTRVPLLEEALDRLGRTPLVVEVKERDAIEVTMTLLRKFDAVGRVLVGSADSRIARRFKAQGFSVCASMTDALRLLPRAILGGSAPPARYSVLSLTPLYGGLPIPVMRMARAARRSGIPTHVWTVNDAMMARAFWQGDVAGIVTDDPATILRSRLA